MSIKRSKKKFEVVIGLKIHEKYGNRLSYKNKVTENVSTNMLY